MFVSHFQKHLPAGRDAAQPSQPARGAPASSHNAGRAGQYSCKVDLDLFDHDMVFSGLPDCAAWDEAVTSGIPPLTSIFTLFSFAHQKL